MRAIPPTFQIFATAIGTFAIFAEVTFVARMFVGVDNLTTAMVFGIFSAFVSVAFWAGWIKNDDESFDNLSWQMWLGMFAIGSVISAFFLRIDCGPQVTFQPKFVCNGNPGIGAVFTIAAVSLSAISLPCSLRAFILSLFDESKPPTERNN